MFRGCGKRAGSTRSTLTRACARRTRHSWTKCGAANYDWCSSTSSFVSLAFPNTSLQSFMTKSALITGITGQDGSYLAELLLDKGYTVHGLVRRSSSFSTGRIDHLYQDIHGNPSLLLHYGDLTDGQALTNLVLDLQPDELYNLGAQSHVRVSFDQPVYTLQTVGVGALN